MSYLQSQISIEEYLNSITDRSKRNHVGSILNIFNSFCNQKFNKSSQQVLDDLIEEINKVHSNDKVYVLFNHFKEWLLVDHPEIVYFMGKDRTQKRTIKARHPNTIKQYLIKIRSIFEEIGNIEINSRLFNKRVKIPKAEEEDPEAFTKEQMRLLLDRCSNHNKLKYMFLKDTGCRIGELVQIRKRDIDTTKTPIQIRIQASYTKTKKARIVFVTRETAPMLKRLLGKKTDEQLVFGTNEDPYVAKGTEKAEFTYYREQLAKDYPEFGERYQSNRRHKKTIHSIRSFTATQCTEAIDEAWGHGYIGHKKYLSQYIRNQSKIPELFKRTENYLMIYQTIELIDTSTELNEMKKEMLELKRLFNLKIKTENEIEQLRNSLT